MSPTVMADPKQFPTTYNDSQSSQKDVFMLLTKHYDAAVYYVKTPTIEKEFVSKGVPDDLRGTLERKTKKKN